MKELIRSIILCIGFVCFKNHKSKAIFYHDLWSEKKYTSMATPVSLFLKHLQIIERKGYCVVDHISSLEGEIVIMFDDGIHGLWDNKELFFERDIRPTVFIAKDLIGRGGYLSESEILYLSDKGWTFQSHSVTHRSLWDCSDSEISIELSESKRYIEELLGKEITEFCAPKGRMTFYAISEAKKSGYQKFYSSTPGDYNDIIVNDSFVVPRLLVQSLSPFQFSLSLSGAAKIFTRRHLRMRIK